MVLAVAMGEGEAERKRARRGGRAAIKGPGSAGRAADAKQKEYRRDGTRLGGAQEAEEKAEGTAVPGADAPREAGSGTEAGTDGQQATGGGPEVTASPAAAAEGPPGWLVSTVGEACNVTTLGAAGAEGDGSATDTGCCWVPAAGVTAAWPWPQY